MPPSEVSGCIVVRYVMEESGQAEALWRPLIAWLAHTTCVRLEDAALYEGNVEIRLADGVLAKVVPYGR